MVVIISSKSDAHATTVLEELRAMGQPAKLLDLSDFPLRSHLSMAYTTGNGAQFTLSTDAGPILFSEVRSIWWRRPQQFQLDPTLQNPGYAQFALNESQEAITGLWQALDVFLINDPARDAAAHRKAHQLRLARELGIPIPETLITNDPAAAREFIGRHGKVICKAFSATEANWRETRLVQEGELANLDSVRFAPVIFQPTSKPYTTFASLSSAPKFFLLRSTPRKLPTASIAVSTLAAPASKPSLSPNRCRPSFTG